MLDEIQFKYGASPGAPILSINPGPITVFVGPNNAGKSVAIREIESYLTRPDLPRLVVQSMHVKPFATVEQLKSTLDAFRSKIRDQQGQLLTRAPIGETLDIQHFTEEGLFRAQNGSSVNQILGKILLLKLDGQQRLSLSSEQPSGDLLGLPPNHLVALFCDPAARARLRKLTSDAFGLHFVIDPTAMNTLRIRMSRRPPVDEDEEQALTKRAREFHQAATEITQMSDGVKAFTGGLAAVLCSAYRIILVDEPEAFLHPPLARKLGLHLAQIAKERDASVVAATHSSSFLMGCVESGIPVQIVRLTYGGEIATARHLPAEILQTLMRDPLLRSADVLGALFHEGAVVTEAATDRAFYQEINHRLLSVDAGGSGGSVFINAQNKQTVCRIIKPLRDLGVPAAGVVDLDVLKEGGKVWSSLMLAIQIPTAMQPSLENLRSTLKRAFDGTAKDMKRDGGLATLSSSDREACQNLLDELARYGLFVVPGGEIECWLKPLGASGHGAEWLVDIFERMGSNPDEADYVRPTSGDVWDFIRRVADWISDPKRKGVSAS